MRLMLTGVLFLIGGLSGGLVLRGTGSSGALAVVGVVMIVIGVVQLSSGQSTGVGGSEPVNFSDPERDREQMEEYERAKAANAAKAGQVALPAEIAALIASTPGAQAEIDQVLQRTKGHLDAQQTREMVVDTAKRLNAEHRRRQQAAGV